MAKKSSGSKAKSFGKGAPAMTVKGAGAAKRGKSFKPPKIKK